MPTFLASHGLGVILLLFAALVLLASALNAVVLAPLNAASDAPADITFVRIWIDGALSILGGNVSGAYEAAPHADASRIALKTASIVLTVLLLGALVYKVLQPSKSLSVFRSRLNLNTELGEIETCYYVATNLAIFDLETSVYAKYYKPVRDDGSEAAFPLHSVALRDEPQKLPLPYSFIPTGVHIPVQTAPTKEAALALWRADQEAMASSASSQKEWRPPLILVVNEGRLELIVIEGETINPDTDEFCEIYVVVQGKVPNAQMALAEYRKYDLPKDLEMCPGPKFKTYFDDKRRYKVRNWKDFDARASRRAEKPADI